MRKDSCGALPTIMCAVDMTRGCTTSPSDILLPVSAITPLPPSPSPADAALTAAGPDLTLWLRMGTQILTSLDLVLLLLSRLSLESLLSSPSDSSAVSKSVDEALANEASLSRSAWRSLASLARSSLCRCCSVCRTRSLRCRSWGSRFIDMYTSNIWKI